MFLSHLRDNLGIKGVRGVSLHEPLSNVRPVIFVKFAHGTARTEVWRALHGAATLRADCGKIVVGVSEDIDPTNTNAVFWSIAYRSNPVEDVHVAPHRSGGHGPKAGRKSNDATLLIDATLKQAFPPLALPGREFMEKARAIWDELGLPALSPQPPWHGYQLGDWAELWDTYAARAISGDWEQSGTEYRSSAGGRWFNGPKRRPATSKTRRSLAASTTCPICNLTPLGRHGPGGSSDLRITGSLGAEFRRTL